MLFINEVCGHTSTGKICAELAEKYEAKGNEVKIAYGRDNFVPEKYQRFAIRIGNDWDVKFHAIYTRLTDKHGLASKAATKKFLKWAENYDPDLLWLHNLHGYYINYEMLFNWIKSRPEMEVKWTLHDCWAFTGHCSHFTYVGCDKWKNGCYDCPQRREYPASLLLDNSKENYKRKKKAFTEIKNLSIITPSHWLESKVKESFLAEYPVEVKHNTIDKNIFKLTPSDFKKRYGLEDKIVILGVANVWNERKGLNDFIELSTMLGEKYAIVLVGLSEKQIRDIPRRIIGFQKTSNQNDLAAIYTSADMFVNPSREETYGMTSVEASKCGTKTIVYKGTACEESAAENKGVVVDQGVENLYEAITGKAWEGVRWSVSKFMLLPRTKSALELVNLYCGADYFVNPTYEDTYPTVNLEARACGTKVVTYDACGSSESATVTITEERN